MSALISKGRIFNTVVVANTDFFAADLTPSITPNTTFRIYIVLDAVEVLSVQRTSGGVTVAEELNGGNNLTADAAYMFDILVDALDGINLQVDQNATILYCLVVEVPEVS